MMCEENVFQMNSLLLFTFALENKSSLLAVRKLIEFISPNRIRRVVKALESAAPV